MLPGQVTRRRGTAAAGGDGQRPGCDLLRVGQAPRARIAAGKMPDGRRHDPHAPALEGGLVLAHRRVLPHLGVHGGAEQHRGPRGEQGGRQQVIGQAGGVASHEVRRGRHHQDQVGALPQSGMGDRRVLVPQRGLRRLRSQGGERQRTDETGGFLGQDRHDMCPGVDQQPAYLHGLVGGDAAADAQHYPGPALLGHGMTGTNRSSVTGGPAAPGSA